MSFLQYERSLFLYNDHIYKNQYSPSLLYSPIFKMCSNVGKTAIIGIKQENIQETRKL